MWKAGVGTCRFFSLNGILLVSDLVVQLNGGIRSDYGFPG